MATTVLLRGGRVHTAADPDATALAITDGVISWLGGEHAVAVAGPAERVVDLDGALVVPGFVDAHVHTTDAGLALVGLDLSAARSLAECLELTRRHAAAVPRSAGAGLLWGHGWDETRWPERRPPTRAELDAAVGDRPVYLARIDVHSAQVSSALARSVSAAAGTDPPGWHPTEPLTRHAHAAARTAARAALTTGEREAAQRAFLDLAVSRGVVEVHECGAADAPGRADLAALLALDGPIPVRGYLAAPVTSAAQAVDEVARSGAHALGGDLAVDGAIGSRTAALRAPYADAASTCGARYLSEQEICDHLVACTEAGVQAGFHAIGDDAVGAVAAALREAARRLGEHGPARLAGCAHRVEHAEMPDVAAIAAFAATGTVLSVQPLFDAAWGGSSGMYAQRLGVDRAAAMNPFGALAAAGVALALGSDAPVTPADPWATVRAAVHRHGGGGLSPRAAFVAHTRGGHRAARRTDRGAGTIAVGAPADLAIVAAGQLVRPAPDPEVQRWSTDPRSRVPLLPDLSPGAPAPRTLATLVGGRVAFDAGLFTRAGNLPRRR